MRKNIVIKLPAPRTHEGAVAARLTPELELRRSVMACLLWEKTFYEGGEDIALRIAGLVPKVAPEKVQAMAFEARENMKLRHVPLLLVREMARHATHRALVADTVEAVVQRADEMGELLSIYAGERPGKRLTHLSKQIQRGLARAFVKFDSYQLAKYNRDTAAVKLRDVLFLCHAKPKNKAQAAIWKRLVDGTLAPPDTWEVALSGGKDKKETWERLIRERNLGALGLLRNLRNMNDVGVDRNVVRQALAEMKVDRVLPFRFIAAARHASHLEPELEAAMFRALGTAPKLQGETTIVVDVSGSMVGAKVSQKSELDRRDAACALAILAREMCQNCEIITFSNEATVLPARRGFALRDLICQQPSGGTYTQKALDLAFRRGASPDRVIVITDEQSHETIKQPPGNVKGYFINVGSYQNGIGYGNWTHIDGWSEAVLQYIQAVEFAQFGLGGEQWQEAA